MMRSPGRCQHTVFGRLKDTSGGVRQTNLGMSFHSKDIDAFDNGSTRVVDAIEHRLNGE